jgi:hypothetical protein
MSKVNNEIYVDAAKDLLTELKVRGVDAIVAGGMPRDYILKKQIKDVDVYIKYTEDTKEAIDLYIERLFSENIIGNRKGSNTYAEAGLNDIVKVVRGNIPHDSGNYTPFEFILVDTDLTLEEYVDTNFDTSICQVMFDGEDYIETPQFTETIKSKEVTFNSKLSIDATGHSIKRHLIRLTRKFPEFKFPFLGKQSIFGGVKRIIKRTALAEKMTKDYILKTDDSIFIGFGDIMSFNYRGNK